MLPRRSRIALALQRARQPELRRSVHRIQRQPFLKRRNGLVIFLDLRIQVADKIICVRFVRFDFRHALERGNSLLHFARVFVRQPEVVPRIRIVRQLLRRCSQRRARGIELLLPEQRDTQVQPRYREFRIRFQRLLEVFLSIRRPLLIHVRNAQRVEAVSDCGVGLGCHLSCACGLFFLLPRVCAASQPERRAKKQSAANSNHNPTPSHHVHK